MQLEHWNVGDLVPKKPQWNEAPCPECREPVSFNASRCPHCQAIYSDSTIQDRKKQQRTNNKIGCGCAAVLGFLLLAFCVGVASDPKDSKGTASTSSQETTAMPKAGSASPQVTEAMVNFQNTIMDGMSPCDQAGNALAERAGDLSSGRASIYDAYNAARRVENACRQSWSTIGSASVPKEFEGLVEDKAEETLEICQNAALAKQMAASTMAEVFDGDTKPSKMAEAQEQASTAQAGVLACVASIFTTAGQAGVDIEKLKRK